MPIGPLELLIIAAVILVLFGASKLPQLGKGLGRGIREFREETRDLGRPGPDAQLLNPELRQDDITDVQATELPRVEVREQVGTEQRDRQA
ncbi:twin-arginine translocase TatA/TatE family subunit [Deinococcus sp. Marseille-Q6407]|uniref:twin-arginine translocase TatA/TatE family subunit n=1 Tax=Deinococcus sp. Marseille-Q6407 TaxID=2969223 RepID=UPI0021BF232F|nr:twin-arginine translocase TatA/TatE family subunit [Deinococcus sp. Marseille-Q6407]